MITSPAGEPAMLAPAQPQFRQLAELIRGKIDSGDYPPGSLLPSEDEFSRRYSVSRRTVNRALGILRADGLIRVDRGRGTIVRELPVIRREAAQRQHIRAAAGARGAFQAELERLGLTSRSEVEVRQEIVPPEIAPLLGLSQGTSALTRHRRMYASDIPVQLATSWLPLDITAGTPIAERDSGPGGIYSRLADLGHRPATFTETVRVRPPAGEESRFLRLDAEQRVLCIRRVATDDGGRVVEVNDIVLPAHQWELVYSWSAGPGAGDLDQG